MVFTSYQSLILKDTERVSSAFSLIGSCFIFTTFLTSKAFRKPINRIIVYASMGNTLMNIATLISVNGVLAGKGSSLCQFQAFLVQMFLPADALWNLVIATNLYLTLFCNYNASQLRSLEWIYFTSIYGTTFLIAFIYCFIETSSRGKIYGPATLWCWVSLEWDFLRLVTCYVPAWLCIIASFSIYAMVGRRILAKRSQLRFFNRLPDRPANNRSNGHAPNSRSHPHSQTHNSTNNGHSPIPLPAYKTTRVEISYEPSVPAKAPDAFSSGPSIGGNSANSNSDDDLEAGERPVRLPIHGHDYEPYSVQIESSGPRPNESTDPIPGVGNSTGGSVVGSVIGSAEGTGTGNGQGSGGHSGRSNKALNTNIAAWAYIRCALLFFATLLITWVPASINRVYTLVHRDPENFGFNYGAALVLPLMGFWNCVIYITISWTASKVFCNQIFWFA